MAKHISGRQRIARFSGLSTGRYRQLRIEEAEPNLGFPTEKSLPLKPNYYQLVTFDGGDTYDRYWQVPPIGFNSIGLSVFDDDFIVGTGNSITRLNFKGNSIVATAEDFSNISTITVSPPGNDTEVLFKNNGDFATSSGFTFDPLDPLLIIEAELKVGAGGTIITALDDARVGIATTQPERTLHINGDMRLTGTIYDYYNNSGTAQPSVLVSNTFGGVEWLPNDELNFFSVGAVYGVQYKSATGTVVSAETFYYNPMTERVGVGTSTPRQTFDLRGDALLEGNIFVSGIATFSNNVEFQSNIQSNFIPTANNTYDLGSSLSNWNNLYVNTLQSIDVDTNTLNVNGLITLSGITSISGSLYPETDATYQLGFDDFKWNDIVSVNGNFSGSVTIGDADTDLAIFNASIGSNLIPDTVSNRDIGDAFFKWRTIYADTIDAVSLKADTLKTETDDTNVNRFLTFISNDNSVADYESYFTNSSLYYNPGSTTLFVSNLIVSGITTFQDTVVIGNDTNDTVNIVSKVDTDILPNVDQSYDLGSSDLKWGDVYGLTFSGNAASATKLETGRLFSINGDAEDSSVFFDGTANVGLALTLVDTGVTAATYGSSTLVPQITVDTKGRITSAVNVGIDFANATVAQANTVLSQSTSNTAYFYPSFLDSNNNLPDYEQLYTNVFLAYQPSTGNFGIGNSEPTAKLHVSGEPRFDIMATFQDEGSIRFDRQDTTSRPFYIKTYNDSTPGGNYMGFDVHNGTTTQASRVLTLRGNGNVGINSVDPTDRFFVGGTSRVTGNATFEGDISIRGAFIDSSFDSGTSGQILLSTETGTNWSNQSNIAAGTADQIRTQRRSDNATHYITFVDSDNSPDAYENLYTADGASNGGITFNPSSGVMNIISPDSIPLVLERKNTGISAIEYKNSSGSMWAGLVNFADWWAIDGDSDLSSDPYLIVNRTDGKVGIGTTQIDAMSRVSIAGTMSPSITELHDLGTPDLKWDTVWAATIDADLVGNADSATALETARDFSLGNDLTSPTVSFDGTANVILNANLVNTGVTSATYGSSTQVPVFDVDAKGRITGVTDTLIDFGNATVDNANNIRTQSIAEDADFNVTFVASNNAPSSEVYESLFTDSGITYNPSKDTLKLSNTDASQKDEAAIWLSGTSGALLLDNLGQKRISWNDGSGNFNIRGGHYFNGGDKYVTASDGASAIILNSDSTAGRIDMKVAPANTGGVDAACSFTSGVRLSGNNFLPIIATSGTMNLGSSGNKWDNVYANTFNGQITGNADTATALETARNFSLGNDITSPIVSFNGTGDVVLNGSLTNTGVTSATYGTVSKVAQFSVDAKGRITSAQELDINFSAATVAFADALTNARNFSLGNDITSPIVSFNGTGDVVLNGSLTNTGVTSDSYGSETEIPTFSVDAKGRITGVTVVGVNFGAATVAQADKVKVTSEDTGTTDRYLCFTDGGAGGYQDIKVDTGLRWNPTGDDLICNGDLVAGRNNRGVALTINDGYGNANITFNHRGGLAEDLSDPPTGETGNSARIVCNTDDLVNPVYLDFYVKTGASAVTAAQLTSIMRINETGVRPATDSTFDLGTNGIRWNHIYADNITATNIIAPITGNADTATALETARNFSVTGDVTTASAVSFDGSADVDLAVSLPTFAGLVAGDYGSATEIPTITLDTKGRVTAVSVNTFTPSNSASADSLLTSLTTTNGTFYPTFVNDNNAAPGESESYFTNVNYRINPGTGNLNVGGSVTANSDVRLKDNVKQIENALDKVLSLRGVEYDRNDLEDNPHQIGVIAQEVEKAFPELVNGQGDEIKSVAYGNFAGVFIEAFKEQQKTIEEQNARIDLLTKQVEALMEKLGG